MNKDRLRNQQVKEAKDSFDSPNDCDYEYDQTPLKGKRKSNK